MFIRKKLKMKRLISLVISVAVIMVYSVPMSVSAVTSEKTSSVHGVKVYGTLASSKTTRAEDGYLWTIKSYQKSDGTLTVVVTSKKNKNFTILIRSTDKIKNTVYTWNMKRKIYRKKTVIIPIPKDNVTNPGVGVNRVQLGKKNRCNMEGPLPGTPHWYQWNFGKKRKLRIGCKASYSLKYYSLNKAKRKHCIRYVNKLRSANTH